MKNKSINFQVRMDKSLKILAEERAGEYGFDSAQDLTKYLLKAVVDGRLVPDLDLNHRKRQNVV